MEDFYRRLKNIGSKYDTDNIFILGKGPSVDEVDTRCFDKGIVIGINDSERIAPADISIFHDDWVLESIRLNGYKSDLYLTNCHLPHKVSHLLIPYVKADQKNSELIVQRFFDKILSIENIMFITALKISRLIADFRMRRQQVYLLGFDFDMSRGYSKFINTDFSGDEKTYQANIISIQEHYLLMFLHLLKDSNIRMVHVGNKPYSSMKPSDFSRRLSPSKDLIRAPSYSAEKSGGADEKDYVLNLRQPHHNVLVTAEITTNHFGQTDILREMVRRSAKAGADLVKVQKRDVDSFYTREQLESPYESPFGATFGDYRRALELDEDQFNILDNVCEECGIDWFLSVLDLPSFRFALLREVSMIKLPSTISQHRAFFDIVAEEYKGDVVVSTGLTDQDFEDFILETFRENSRLYLLQCNSAYPTPPNDCNIGVVRRYHEHSRRYTNVIPGYSSHDFGSEGSMLAVAAGARMIEKHVKFGDTNWAHFDSVALDLKTNAFATFVQDIRRAELLCGTEYKKINESEHHKYWGSNT